MSDFSSEYSLLESAGAFGLLWRILDSELFILSKHLRVRRDFFSGFSGGRELDEVVFDLSFPL